MVTGLLLSEAHGATWPDRIGRRVNDFAGVLKGEEREALEAKLRDYEERTTNQIVVAIFPSLEGEDRDDLTNRLYRSWKLGQEDKDNGVLLAIYVADRKMRIEVGYGLESLLTDALSSRILRDDLTPALREGKYAEGIDAAVTSMQRVISGEKLPARSSSRRRSQTSPRSLLLLAFMVVAIILAASAARRSMGAPMTVGRRGWNRYGRRSGGVWWPGGFGGGGFGGGGFGGGGFGGGGGFSGGGGSSGGGGAGGSW